jgi:mediator of RNA polymerase II transcription subunit 16
MDPAEDLHAVVGAFWLNLYPMQQRPVCLNGFNSVNQPLMGIKAVIHSLAIKTAEDYRYEMAQTVSFGPCYPHPQKSALICLTTNGVLRLLWPQNDGKWNESTSEIESVVSSNDLITHASICADKSTSSTP